MQQLCSDVYSCLNPSISSGTTEATGFLWILPFYLMSFHLMVTQLCVGVHPCAHLHLHTNTPFSSFFMSTMLEAPQSFGRLHANSGGCCRQAVPFGEGTHIKPRIVRSVLHKILRHTWAHTPCTVTCTVSVKKKKKTATWHQLAVYLCQTCSARRKCATNNHVQGSTEEENRMYEQLAHTRSILPSSLKWVDRARLPELSSFFLLSALTPTHLKVTHPAFPQMRGLTSAAAEVFPSLNISTT